MPASGEGHPACAQCLARLFRAGCKATLLGSPGRLAPIANRHFVATAWQLVTMLVTTQKTAIPWIPCWIPSFSKWSISCVPSLRTFGLVNFCCTFLLSCCDPNVPDCANHAANRAQFAPVSAPFPGRCCAVVMAAIAGGGRFPWLRLGYFLLLRWSRPGHGCSHRRVRASDSPNPDKSQSTDGGQSTKGCAISNLAAPYPPNGGWLNAAKGNSLRQG